MPVKKPLPKPVQRTKAEVEREFSGVKQELAEERKESNSKLAESERIRDSEVRESVAGLTVEGARERLSSLGIEISRALSGLADKVAAEVELLESARQAVRIEGRELERLHRMDVTATALDQMVDDYDRRKRELDDEVATKRAAWEEESASRAKEVKEQEEALRKQRQREVDEYEYRKALERKKAQDKYDEEIRVQEKKNQERQEALEKSWKLREAALKEQEEAVTKLKAEAAGFPDRLAKEVERARAEAVAMAEVRIEQKMVLLQKDAETERKLAELRIRTLEEMSARQVAQVAALEKQLDDTKTQVQEIAVKAIEGASGSRALSHINQIAMEQAKNRPGQG